MVGTGVSEVGVPASSEESVDFGWNRHRKSKVAFHGLSGSRHLITWVL